MRSLAYWLSLGLVFLIPWENAIIVFNFGTFTRFIGTFAAVVWLFSVLIEGEIRKFHRFHIIAFLFIMWNISSIYWTANIDTTTIRVRTYVQLGILTCILWDLLLTEKNVHAAMQSYILGGYILIFSTFYNFYIGQGISGRYTALGSNPNDLALNLAIGIPFAYYMAFFGYKWQKSRWLILPNYLYIPAATIAIVLTASRGASIAAIPAFLYITVSLRRLNPILRWLIFISTLTVIILSIPLIPQFSYQRLGTILHSIKEGNLGGRMHIWKSIVGFFMDRPLTGHGSGALPSAHNVFLAILGETGLIGLSLFILLLWDIVIETLRIKRREVALWLAVLAVWFIGALVHNWEYRKSTWLILNLSVINVSITQFQKESWRESLYMHCFNKGRL